MLCCPFCSLPLSLQNSKTLFYCTEQHMLCLTKPCQHRAVLHSLLASLGKMVYVAQYSEQPTLFHFFHRGMWVCVS